MIRSKPIEKPIMDALKDVLPAGVQENFREILESVEATKGDFFKLQFDPTLVRGMSYYTGTIFEVAMPEFGGSCGGGGRYDKMVGKFTGNKFSCTPAGRTSFKASII